MAKCFNGHDTDHPGCAGCHHLYHVEAPGRVERGLLVAPSVRGPESCEFCHDARHQVAVPGCARCAQGILDTVTTAQAAAAPIRKEILELKFRSWLLGWQTTIMGWTMSLLGSAYGGWFRGGPRDWLKVILLMVGIPSIQWALKREIKKRERQLPRLGPGGVIVYGDESETTKL